jgi:hypothetical protein
VFLYCVVGIASSYHFFGVSIFLVVFFFVFFNVFLSRVFTAKQKAFFPRWSVRGWVISRLLYIGGWLVVVDVLICLRVVDNARNHRF